MDGWMNERTNERTNEQIIQSANTVAQVLKASKIQNLSNYSTLYNLFN